MFSLTGAGEMKRTTLVLVCFVWLPLVCAITLAWYPRRHINRQAFAHIRVGVTTEREIISHLGSPNKPAWDTYVEKWIDGLPTSESAWYETFWHGSRDCIGILFDNNGVVRGRRT